MTLEVDDWFVFSKIDILIRTEVFGKRNAREVLAPGAVVDGSVIEDHEKDSKYEDDTGEAEEDEYGTSGSGVNCSIKSYVRHECIGEQEPSEESSNVGIIINPGKKTKHEEYEDNGKKFS